MSKYVEMLLVAFILCRFQGWCRSWLVEVLAMLVFLSHRPSDCIDWYWVVPLKSVSFWHCRSLWQSYDSDVPGDQRGPTARLSFLCQALFACYAAQGTVQTRHKASAALTWRRITPKSCFSDVLWSFEVLPLFCNCPTQKQHFHWSL